MITVQKTLYAFNELSAKAQQNAIDKTKEHTEYVGHDENEASLRAFEQIFPIKVKDYQYGYRSYITFDMTCDDEISELKGLRLVKYIWNNYKRKLFKGKYYSTKGIWIDGKYNYKFRHSNIILEHSCVLTGYCVDDDLLEPVYSFLSKPSGAMDFQSLMEDCLNAWIKVCDADYEYTFSDECIREYLQCDDECRFDGNGKIAS